MTPSQGGRLESPPRATMKLFKSSTERVSMSRDTEHGRNLTRDTERRRSRTTRNEATRVSRQRCCGCNWHRQRDRRDDCRGRRQDLTRDTEHGRNLTRDTKRGRSRATRNEATRVSCQRCCSCNWHRQHDRRGNRHGRRQDLTRDTLTRDTERGRSRANRNETTSLSRQRCCGSNRRTQPTRLINLKGWNGRATGGQ